MSASYLNTLLNIDGKLTTKLYDKRDDFSFSIVNNPYLCSNIPSSPAYGALDSKGKHFIITFMENKILQHSDIKPEIFITTSSTKNVHVNVTSPRSHNPNINEHFTITRGQVHRVQVDPNFRLNQTELGYKGILISADEEVVVYGVNREVWSDDAYLALPTDVLGKEYYTVSYSPSFFYSEFAVMGVQDHTRVHIKLANHPNISVSFRGHTYHKNQWINVTLNRFSTLEINSVGDLTGTHIISSEPVGVISGNKKTSVGNGKSRDHLTEMLLPVQAWGKNFATVPIPERTVGDIFRFVASEDNTHVNVNGVIDGKPFTDQFVIPHAGDHIQKMYSSKLYSHVVSDHPIALYQFSVTENRWVNELADPSLIMIPPIEQYAADYTFATPEYSKGQYQNYFMFVLDSNQRAGLILDGKPLPQNQTYVHIPGTNLVAGYVNISVGTHSVTHNNPNTVIGGIVFGKAAIESYGFPIGLLTQPVNSGCQAQAMSPGDKIDNDCDGEVDEEDCDGQDNDDDGKIDEDCSGEPLTVIGKKK